MIIIIYNHIPQILRVKAPFVNKFILDNTDDTFAYILPK